ncbi:MAG TPA: COX15/CtaA family protein [Candidatus Dormibacteraeota bacterium]
MLTTRRFRLLAGITALSGYLQITLGGLVRVSGSGLGCPDWPTCYGKPYPPPTFHAIVEYSHRANGALFGLLVILTVIAGFWLYRGRRTTVTWLTLATLLTVVGEGLLGWQVVATLLAPVLVLVHLAIALVILALMVAIFILAGPAPTAAFPDRSFARLAVLAAGLTYLMLLTGSSVVATSADLVCKSWPLCGGGLSPDFSGVAFFAMLHRLTVGVVSLVLLFLFTSALRRHRNIPGVGLVAAGTLVVLLAQIVLGALVAVTDEQAFLQGGHVMLASAVWAGVVALAVLSLRPAADQASEIGDDSRVTALERRPA